MRRGWLFTAITAAALVAACNASQATPTPAESSSAATSGPSAPSSAVASGSATASAPATEAASPVASASASASIAPSEAPSASASPSASPSAAPSSAPTVGPVAACAATQLAAQIINWSGAMGSQIADVKLTNTSSVSCKLRGTPGLQLVDHAGKIVMDSKTQGASGLPHVAPGDPTFLLAPSGAVTTMVAASNYCGSANPARPVTIAFLLPANGGRLVAKAGPGDGVPPCMGDAGSPGTISMNGWAK